MLIQIKTIRVRVTEQLTLFTNNAMDTQDLLGCEVDAFIDSNFSDVIPYVDAGLVNNYYVLKDQYELVTTGPSLPENADVIPLDFKGFKELSLDFKKIFGQEVKTIEFK